MINLSNNSIGATLETILVMDALQNLAKELEAAQAKKLPKAFIVKVDDPRGLYLRSMINVIKEHIDMKNLNKIEEGDFIIFAENDVRLEKNPFLAANKILQLNLEKLYLVSDYQQVEESINNYFTKVFKPKAKETVVCCGCPFAMLCGKVEAPKAKKEERIYDGEWVNVEEKVSIWSTFVKVGLRQYPIRDNGWSNDTVRISGTIYEIRKDNGKKYLVKA